MKVNISYFPYRKFKELADGHMRCWFWYCRAYKYVWGVNGRIFGVGFNIREKNATEKLIKLFRETRRIARVA